MNSIYLKIVDGAVEAYGDLESARTSEEIQKTGRLYDLAVSSEQWEQAFYTARIENGKIVVGMTDEQEFARKASAIREERAFRLQECDAVSPMRWNAMTDAQKQAWTDYRQALLDVPQQDGFPWGGDPEAAPWPERPE